MDKQNYTIKGLNKQDIEQNFLQLKEKIYEAFKEAKIIKRRRVIGSYDILTQAAYLYIVRKLSFQRLSDVMSVNYGVTMSDTAWKKNLRKAAPVFQKAVLHFLQEKTAEKESENSARGQTGSERKTYAVDATDIAQEGNGNIVMRVHTQLRLECHAEVNALIKDNHDSENVERLPIAEGALYVADRAYGKANQLAFMYSKKADFVFRISPNHIKLYADEECRVPLDYERLLSGDSFDCSAYFRFEKRVYSARVLGEKLPEEKQERAEKRARRKAAKNRAQIQNKTIEYAKWMILITSLSENASEIIKIYRERWQIELFFKRAKTIFGLKKFDIRQRAIGRCFLSFGWGQY